MLSSESKHPCITAVVPLSGEAETILSSAGEVGTDPHTAQSLTIERTERLRLSKAATGTRQNSRTAILISVAAGVVVLLGINFALSGKSGTLHLEITDDGSEIASTDSKKAADLFDRRTI